MTLLDLVRPFVPGVLLVGTLVAIGLIARTARDQYRRAFPGGLRRRLWDREEEPHGRR